jgi:DNA-binding CsgD family transcriptional regulator
VSTEAAEADRDGSDEMVSGEVPLVGRESELALVSSALTSGEVQAVVIAGTAGLGKSRLAREAAGALESQGWLTARVIATRGVAVIPFGAFAALLVGVESPTGERHDLLAEASREFARRDREDGPLAVVVDDAHLLDDGSAALLLEIVRAGACRAIVTLRTPEPAPDPVTALWKEGFAARVELSPLSEAEVQLLAEADLGGPVTAPSVRALYAATEGNPMFVRELLLGAREHGAITRREGVWVLEEPLALPDRLVELVRARLDGLDDDAADVVDLLALGEPLRFGLLEAMTGSPAVESAEVRGLLVVRESGGRAEASLAHPLYGEVRRQSMAHARLRRLTSRLAAATLASPDGDNDEDALRIARWQLDAGDGGSAEVLVRAADAARRKCDLELAARLARAALDAGGGVAAALALGEAEFLGGHHAEAEAVLSEAVGLCRDDVDLAKIANARSYVLGFLVGDRVGAEAIISDALEQVDDPVWHLRLVGRRATMRTWGADLRGGLEDALTLVNSEDPTVAFRGTMMSGVALALLGRTADALRESRHGLELFDRGSAGPVTREAQLIAMVLAHLAAGQAADADRVSTEGYEAALAAHDKDAIATFSLLRGLVLIELGALGDAARMFREGAAVNEEISDPGPQRWCVGGVALAEGMSGHAREAAAAISRLEQLAEHWMAGLDPVTITRGRSWAIAASGELSAARARLAAGAEVARRLELYPGEALLLHDVARLGDAGSVTVRLAELTSIVDGALVGALSQHANATARGHRPGLELAANEFEALGLRLLSAEAAAQAAAACRREGDDRRASSWDRKTYELWRLCGDVRTPLLSLALEVEPLTTREREVAEMAASGASTKEISERLYISTRTVENHLHRAFAKLGVNRREQLSDALAIDDVGS